jgi:hypothetical protein
MSVSELDKGVKYDSMKEMDDLRKIAQPRLGDIMLHSS